MKKYLKFKKGKRGPKVIDYTGKKVGKLTVLCYNDRRWHCKCECGKKAIIRVIDIKNKSRIGCRSCTASMRSVKRYPNYDHYGYRKRLFKEYKREVCIGPSLHKKRCFVVGK